MAGNESKIGEPRRGEGVGVAGQRDGQAVVQQPGERPRALDVVAPDQVQPRPRHRRGRVAEHLEQQAAYLTVGAGVLLRPAARAARRRLAGGPPRADVLDRAGRAARRAGGADHGAELHEGRARPGRPRGFDRQQGEGGDQVGRPGGRAGVGRAGHRPRHEPADVGVDDRLTLAVRERGHGPRGVLADARQREQRVEVGGHHAAVPLDDRHRALPQPQRPPRVAESPPHPDRLGGRIRGLVGRRGPAFQPRVVRREHARRPASAGA